jgi:hypothetical protein
VRSFTRFRYISYLDLVTCSFGGALLLFLIAVSASPVAPRQGPVNEMVVVVYRHRGGPKAEVGIEFKRPGQNDFSPPGSKHANVPSFSARSGPNSGGDCFLVLTRPEGGDWEFRVWQKDFPTGADADGGVGKWEVIGQGLETLEDTDRGAVGPLRGPGEHAARSIRVRIRRP